MNFIIPMAGNGSRFVDAGFDIPKFLIKANGKKIIEYSLKSLPLEIATKIIFVALEKHNRFFSLKKELQSLLPNGVKFELLLIDKVTQGQAETVYLTKNLIDFSKDLVIYNIDTFFESNSLKKTLLSSTKFDGVLGSFKDSGANWSFAKVGVEGFVEKTSEKIPISNNALTGFYHFSNPHDFFDSFEYHKNNNIKFKDEFYIAPMYNYLIMMGKRFVLDFTNTFVPLGTPEEIKAFDPNFTKKN